MAKAAKKKQKPQEPATRSFALLATPGDDQVARVCVGANPRVCIVAGETFATDNARLADRLAADPLLEETTAP